MTALMGLRENLGLSRVHVVLDLPKDPATWVDRVTELFDAGADLVQVGGRRLHSRDGLAGLERIREATFARRGLLAVCGDLKAAHKFGSDLVMLTPDERDVTCAKARGHEFGLVGREVASAGEVSSAASDSDYLYVGIDRFDRDLVASTALEFSGEAGEGSSAPWYAGGLAPADVEAALQAGATRVALRADLLGEGGTDALADAARRVNHAWAERSQSAGLDAAAARDVEEATS